MDISAEVAAVQAASQGSQLRDPLIDALNKLNSGTLPSVTSQDIGKILKVGANGWELGEKSGYMPVPTATKQITENGTHDVTDYASAVVNVSGGGGSVLISKTITENGTYNPADDNADGYNEVVVNVSSLNWNEPIVRNWDFTNPVNTRGSSSYSGVASINGWKCLSGTTCVIANGGIYVRGAGTNMYYQFPISTSDYSGKVFTLSLLVDGELETSTFTFSSSTGRETSVSKKNIQFWLNLDSSSSAACGFYNSGSGNDSLIQGIKLELGNTQTLAKQVNGIWELIRHQNIAEETIFVRRMATNF